MDLLKTVAVLACAPGVAFAHVSVTPTTATAGGYQLLRFGVGHGCQDTHATTALRIALPEDLGAARPQPKPGWSLKIAKDSITWEGSLPPDQYEEFLILVRMPASSGALAFPATQTCGPVVVRWDQPGGANPAPKVTLTATPAPAPNPGHDHQH